MPIKVSSRPFMCLACSQITPRSDKFKTYLLCSECGISYSKVRRGYSSITDYLRCVHNIAADASIPFEDPWYNYIYANLQRQDLQTLFNVKPSAFRYFKGWFNAVKTAIPVLDLNSITIFNWKRSILDWYFETDLMFTSNPAMFDSATTERLHSDAVEDVEEFQRTHPIDQIQE